MLHRIKEGQCFSATITIANVALACIDGTIAAVSFSQLLRIHLRNKQLGWTRQKVFHLMIGCSNIGYLIYFTSTLVATCMGWSCWSHACAFILMACPQILFLAAFLLLLSFWVDLCHQTNDEDEEDEDDSSYEALLENTKDKSGQLHVNYHRKCCPLHALHVGSRQRFVILVVVLIFALMIVFSVLIWVGMGKNPINSSVIARVYLDLFATTILLLGGALSCYDIIHIWWWISALSYHYRVSGLLLCCLCLGSQALSSDIPLLSCLHMFSELHVECRRAFRNYVAHMHRSSNVGSTSEMLVPCGMFPLVTKSENYLNHIRGKYTQLELTGIRVIRD